MNKILSLEEARKNPANNTNQKIVLVGGCFDVLHIGHLRFLEQAKKQGDALWILLESDETIAKSKGHGRPINNQSDRAQLLAAMALIDHIVLLKPFMNNQDYDALIIGIKPAIIATTQGDINRMHKERQAKLIDAHVVDVIDHIQNQSTTKLIKLFQEL